MSLARDRRIVATSVAALTGLALYSSRSTWLDLIMSLNNGTEGQSSKVAQKTASSSHDGGDVSTAAKSVSDSSFECSYPVTPDMCDSNGRLYGGELLKLVDVIAGVASRRHSGCTTVTVSVDRVVFLQEIRVGDVVHLSVSVNRAWSTSLETGVRCMREDGHTGKRTYACHAYLTFVALPAKPAPSRLPSFLLPTPPKYHLPAIAPQNLLEKKRYLLAGRRRGHRIQRQPAQSSLLASFRSYIFSIPLVRPSSVDDAAQEAQIMALQRDLVVEAYLAKHPDVRVDGEDIVAELEGFMDPVRVPLAEVEKAAKAKGRGAFRPLAPTRELSESQQSFEEVQGGAGPNESSIDLEETFACSMSIVRPQHTNSANNLFGGQLLLWLEQVSFMAARKLSPTAWSTAALDSMTFKESVKQGETVFLRAVVLHTWDSSVEIYAVATGESPTTPSRFVADAFLTLIAIDSSTGRPLRGKLRHLIVPTGPGQKLAEGAKQRRAERLEDKRVLTTMYGGATR